MRQLVALLVVAALAGCGSSREALPRSAVSVDGVRIAVQDNCHDDPRLDVDEGDSTVEINFSVAAQTGGECFSCTVSTLQAPIGARSIIDAATGKVVPQTGDCFTELE